MAFKEKPMEWRWCGCGELIGTRQRYRILSVDELARLVGCGNTEDFRSRYPRSSVSIRGRETPQITKSCATNPEITGFPA
jgi:hypothetical protein